eukprot:Skav233238  [mRNA]  locus=scaffold2786:2160:2996:- [translate_table: standard]
MDLMAWLLKIRPFHPVSRMRRDALEALEVLEAFEPCLQCLEGYYRWLTEKRRYPPVPKFPKLPRLGPRGRPRLPTAECPKQEAKQEPKKEAKKALKEWTPKQHVMEPKQNQRFEKISEHLRKSMVEKQMRTAADLTFDTTYKILSELDVPAILNPPSSDDLNNGNVPSSCNSDHSMSHEIEEDTIACDKVIAVHQFMLREIRKFVEEFKSAPGVFYDFDTARLCTGVATLVKLEEEFELTKADLDRAMAKHHLKLRKQRDFRRITDDINELLSEFDEP